MTTRKTALAAALGVIAILAGVLLMTAPAESPTPVNDSPILRDTGHNTAVWPQVTRVIQPEDLDRIGGG